MEANQNLTSNPDTQSSTTFKVKTILLYCNTNMDPTPYHPSELASDNPVFNLAPVPVSALIGLLIMIKRLLRTRSYERAELDDQVCQTYLLSLYLTQLTCCSLKGSFQLNSFTLNCNWNNQLNCPHIHFPPDSLTSGSHQSWLLV